MNNQLEETLRHVQPEWDDARAEKALSGMERRRQRRLVARGSGVLVAVASAAVLVFMFSSEQKDITSIENVPAQVATPVVDVERQHLVSRGAFYLPDGTSGIPADDQARLTVLTATDKLVSIKIDEGRCNFDVARVPDREFSVQVGQVTVSVLGTEFFAELVDYRSRVGVSKGRVLVEWPGGSDELFAGQEGLFPPADLSDAGTPASTKTEKRHETLPDWRHHARKGEFDEAAEALQRSKNVTDTVDDLLLAADSMRLSGHPVKALPYLERVIKLHRDDPRAPLAEFTRGRLLLLQLGQPRLAAMAFRTARLLAPSGNLAQDAMAREVEAWHRVGETTTARLLAEEYLEKYPKGRRQRAVRRFGGLD